MTEPAGTQRAARLENPWRTRASSLTGHGPVAAMILTWVLVAAACGSSSSAITPADDTSADSTVGADIPGPEEFGLTMEGLALRVEQVEAVIGECMSEAGFEYIPVDFDTIRQAQSASSSLPGVRDEDFVAQYGFGLTTLAGRPDPMATIAQGQNAAIFAALAEADQVAYTRTLLGENEDASFVVGLEDEDFSGTGGCTRQAVEQFFSFEQLRGSYVNPGDVLINSDSRMIEALSDWSSCLANAGYDYDTPDDLDEDLVDRVNAILGGRDPSELTGTSLDDLEELQGFERAIAVLAEDCEEEHIVPVEEQIESELYGAPQG